MASTLRSESRVRRWPRGVQGPALPIPYPCRWSTRWAECRGVRGRLSCQLLCRTQLAAILQGTRSGRAGRAGRARRAEGRESRVPRPASRVLLPLKGLTTLAEDAMEIGMIGLGKMGANMATRLIHGGHRVVAYDRSADAIAR